MNQLERKKEIKEGMCVLIETLSPIWQEDYLRWLCCTSTYHNWKRWAGRSSKDQSDPVCHEIMHRDDDDDDDDELVEK